MNNKDDGHGSPWFCDPEVGKGCACITVSGFSEMSAERCT